MATFLVPQGWIQRSAAAVVSRNGNDLASCLSDALTNTEQFYSPPSGRGAASLDMNSCVQELRRGFESQMGSQMDADRSMFVDALVRTACSVVVYEFTRSQLPNTTSNNGAGASEVVEAETGGLVTSSSAPRPVGVGVEEVLGEAKQRLLKGLLYAFEAFQDAHTKPRSPNQYGGFPGWDTAALITLVHGIQRIAQEVSTVEEDSVGNLVRNWRKLFVYLQTSDSTVEDSKSRRRGALAVVNALLMVLFQHNNTHQCRIILRSIEQNEQTAEATKDPLKSVLQPSQHLVAEIVKFRFYQGRMKLYEKAFRGAFNSFLDAYRLLPPLVSAAAHNASTINDEQRANKLRTHFYLITSGLLCGIEAPREILSQEPLSEALFSPLYSAIRAGSPDAFSQIIDVNASVLRRRGVYMLLQPARLHCYLYLLHSVHASMARAGKEPSMIPFAVLVAALDASNAAAASLVTAAEVSSVSAGIVAKRSPSSASAIVGTKRLRVEVDGQLKQDDISLWLARLISRGLVKGYLSYEHQTLVLSKKEPFPTISEVRTANAFVA